MASFDLYSPLPFPVSLQWMQTVTWSIHIPYVVRGIQMEQDAAYFAYMFGMNSLCNPPFVELFQTAVFVVSDHIYL